jgi:hypothetical protein
MIVTRVREPKRTTFIGSDAGDNTSVLIITTGGRCGNIRVDHYRSGIVRTGCR